MNFNWTDGITCSVLRDGDAVAQVALLSWVGESCTYTAGCENGMCVGIAETRDAAKAAAERAIHTMRGEGEG